jgi:hypothetical protein
MPPTARSLGAVAFGLFVGAWLGRALFVWILDLSRTWEIVGVVAAALVGGGLCLAGLIDEADKRQRASD